MLSLVCFLVLAKTDPPKKVTVTTETYRIWPGCFRVSNGVVDLVVVPQIGRIMRFGLVGQRNVLWESQLSDGKPPSGGGWANWGGDKVWPAPQDAWGWPPETEYDGGPWDVKAIPNGVKMVSRSKSAKLGLTFERTVLMSDSLSEFSVINTLKNESGKAVRFGAWEICQVDNPSSCLLPTLKSTKQPNGWRNFGKENVSAFVTDHGSQVEVRSDPKVGHKYGSGSVNGFLTAFEPGFGLMLSTSSATKGEFADQGCAKEIYTSGDPLKYVELELLGPLVTLKQGQSTSLTVRMNVYRRSGR